MTASQDRDNEGVELDLQLDPEMVKDLEPGEHDMDEIRGGYCVAGYTYAKEPGGCVPSGATN
jgi:hypothetical protein